jgi:hypothetical protein
MKRKSDKIYQYEVNMKINIYSITFKTLLLLIISISMFIFYILSDTADERLISLFMFSIIILSYYIYKSLKPLNNVEQNFNNLNEEISKKEAHLKDAQRIAKIGSWEYNLVTKTLSLSDEVYRTLGIKSSTAMEWEDFLNYIDNNDYNRVLAVLDNAIKNGSTFDLKYALISTFAPKSKQILSCAS